MIVARREVADAATDHRIGIPYKRFRVARPFDVIVVGSGIGGVATAALLAKAARRRVLERHYTAGGFTHVFHRPGFEWDVHTPERFESNDLRSRTPIRKLFLTGQDVGTEGIMGAVSGAVTTASVMLRRNLFLAIPKAAAA